MPPIIYLASASPRRQELLRQLGITFEVIASTLPELRAADEAAEQYVARMARAKAHYVATWVLDQKLEPLPVLGADTEVVLDEEVLGKPRDRKHGLAMLARLQGRAHDVLTAVTLWHEGSARSILSRSQIRFASMTSIEIEHYWDTGEPADKAGGYAIQGRGAVFIEHLQGSYTGVMGLPLFETAQLLRQAGLVPR